LEENCDCRYGILYAPMLGGVVFAGFVILASSPYSLEECGTSSEE
jgi:hypothetical protein